MQICTKWPHLASILQSKYPTPSIFLETQKHLFLPSDHKLITQRAPLTTMDLKGPLAITCSSTYCSQSPAMYKNHEYQDIVLWPVFKCQSMKFVLLFLGQKFRKLSDKYWSFYHVEHAQVIILVLKVICNMFYILVSSTPDQNKIHYQRLLYHAMQNLLDMQTSQAPTTESPKLLVHPQHIVIFWKS